jgi:hypothetical protein
VLRGQQLRGGNQRALEPCGAPGAAGQERERQLGSTAGQALEAFLGACPAGWLSVCLAPRAAAPGYCYAGGGGGGGGGAAAGCRAQGRAHPSRLLPAAPGTPPRSCRCPRRPAAAASLAPAWPGRPAPPAGGGVGVGWGWGGGGGGFVGKGQGRGRPGGRGVRRDSAGTV